MSEHLSFFTVSAGNYLARTRVLSDSLREHHPKSKLFVVIMERHLDFGSLLRECSCEAFLLPDDVWGYSFESFAIRHNVIENSTALKADAFLRLWECGATDRLIYLDPDIWVAGSMDGLVAALDKEPILATPHHLHDESTDDGVVDNMLRSLMCGSLNLGFLGLRRCDETVNFLHWWRKKNRSFCKVDFNRGLFVDQKWMDLAMHLFNIGILRDPGYNVANWNTSQRPIRRAHDGWQTNGVPLKFFHFSGHASGKDMPTLTKYSKQHCDDVLRLRAEYTEQVLAAGEDEARKLRCSYDFFDSGEFVSDRTRKFLGSRPDILKLYPEPYSASNADFLAHKTTH